jgi:hypothetical protein
MIFNEEHRLGTDNLEHEAAELLSRYNQELTRAKISSLKERLLELDEDSDEYDSIIREITELQK